MGKLRDQELEPADVALLLELDGEGEKALTSHTILHVLVQMSGCNL